MTATAAAWILLVLLFDVACVLWLIASVAQMRGGGQ